MNGHKNNVVVFYGDGEHLRIYEGGKLSLSALEKADKAKTADASDTAQAAITEMK